MTRRVTLPAVSAALALGACTMPATSEVRLHQVAGYAGVTNSTGALVVTRTGVPFGYDEGAGARRAADQICGGAGVATTTRDNFQDGAWIFPGGCA